MSSKENILALLASSLDNGFFLGSTEEDDALAAVTPIFLTSLTEFKKAAKAVFSIFVKFYKARASAMAAYNLMPAVPL